MEAICSSETSVDFLRTTRWYIQGDSTLFGGVAEIRTGYLPNKTQALPLEFTSSVVESEVVPVLSQAPDRKET
jgi:hypothetical protein